jgi:hypothetical protein
MTSNALQNNLTPKTVLQKNPEYQHWYRMTTRMQKKPCRKIRSYIGIEEQPNWKKSCRKITRIVGTEQHLGAFFFWSEEENIHGKCSSVYILPAVIQIQSSS